MPQKTNQTHTTHQKLPFCWCYTHPSTLESKIPDPKFRPQHPLTTADGNRPQTPQQHMTKALSAAAPSTGRRHHSGHHNSLPLPSKTHWASCQQEGPRSCNHYTRFEIGKTVTHSRSKLLLQCFFGSFKIAGFSR